MMAVRHVVSPVMFLTMVSACGGDGPAGNLPRFADLTDPTVVSAKVATLDSAFAAPVTKAYLALAPLMSLAGGLGPGATAPQRSTCAAPFSAAAAATLLGTGLAPALSDSIVRHVFAWDSSRFSYRLTSDSSGPPAGVRFLIYPIDTIGQIRFPLSLIGHLDLIDVSGGGQLTLHAQVTDGAGGGADYGIVPTGTSSYAAYAAVLAGNVTNGPYDATFSDTTGLVGSTLTVAASVDVPADSHVSLSATRAVADPFDNYYTLRFNLRHGQETVGLSGTISTYRAASTTNLTVTVNAVAFATVTNDANGLVFTRGDGQPVGTRRPRRSLTSWTSQRSLFQAFITLFAPARRAASCLAVERRHIENDELGRCGVPRPERVDASSDVAERRRMHATRHEVLPTECRVRGIGQGIEVESLTGTALGREHQQLPVRPKPRRR